jgi:hypothetical protein
MLAAASHSVVAGPMSPSGFARDSSIVFEKVSSQTSGVVFEVLPSTIL